MDKTVVGYFLSTFLIVCLNAFPCVPSVAAVSLNEKQLAEMLHNIDRWPDSSTNYSEASWRHLVAAARVIQKCDKESVEKTLREFQNIKMDSLQGIYDDSKIYLLLRVVFDLPEAVSAKAERRAFAGWVTFDTEFNNDGTVNLAWPLVWEGGSPHLISGLRGLQGINARYNAAKEYDYFLGKYPFRDLMSFKYGKSQ